MGNALSMDNDVGLTDVYRTPHCCDEECEIQQRQKEQRRIDNSER